MDEEQKTEKQARDRSHPTPVQLFLRTQLECLRRALTPFLMYMFMSMLGLAVFALAKNAHAAVKIALTALCLAMGVFYNGHLCYNAGKLHFAAYSSGELYRKREAEGIPMPHDHRPEREYRAWKGFLIGFYVGLPAVILSLAGGIVQLTAANGFIPTLLAVIFMLISGWAFFPITCAYAVTGVTISWFWSLLMVLLPIAVSGAMYLVGAHSRARSRKPSARDGGDAK